jgi:hypothetical protein
VWGPEFKPYYYPSPPQKKKENKRKEKCALILETFWVSCQCSKVEAFRASEIAGVQVKLTLCPVPGMLQGSVIVLGSGYEAWTPWAQKWFTNIIWLIETQDRPSRGSLCWSQLQTWVSVSRACVAMALWCGPDSKAQPGHIHYSTSRYPLSSGLEFSLYGTLIIWILWFVIIILVLGIELRDLSLLGKGPTTWASLLVCLLLIFFFW